jgi:hypothetical protein
MPGGHVRTIFRQRGGLPTMPGGQVRSIFRHFGKRPMVPGGHLRGGSITTLRQFG